MKLSGAIVMVSWLAASVAAVPHENVLRNLHHNAMANLRRKELEHPPQPGGCSLNTAAKRRDWDALTVPEKKAYIQAAQCMFRLPSRSDKSWAAGARVRYDDWPAIHINQTRFIHTTGNFLTYHRYLTWTYEQALREDCGYKGTQPYWNWFKYQDDPTKNPLMDGSDTSMGGNGAYVEHNGTLAAGLVYLLSGPGGGCIERGPFANLTVNLGPINPAMRGMPPSVPDTNAYNPRCLRRDLNFHASARWHTYANLRNVTTGPIASANVLRFQNELQGRPPDGFLGLHSGGHHTIGGDNSDNYSSAVDPLFWFHHAMVDYVYWLWQALYPERAREVMGTRLPRDESMGYTQRTDVLEMGATGENRVLEDLLDTMGGTPACYIYEY
ncbi:Di-copper centre-containing protein [Apiospora saccharicola]|uniref:Di-copper centre-containing protein n=1 Tax=Apiospora saccharicola TaxID=335842 RepID=A0ABR1U4T2_9PEZI